MAISIQRASPLCRVHGGLIAATRTSFLAASLATCLTAGTAGAALQAQAGAGAERESRAAATNSRWSVMAPEASLAWFELLADLQLPGAGAFPFVIPGGAGAQTPLARAVARSRDFEILHFVPLYYPTANRPALAAALRAAAATPSIAPAPRAALLVTALSNTLSASVRREWLPEIAAALELKQPVAPTAARLAMWQHRLDSLYLPALAPWLREERLDAGRLVVSPAIGAEGRIFAGTTDRTDNIIAVGTNSADPDPDAPLLAYVRELCFPAVSRATASARGFSTEDPQSARRASLAAVRCGADLLDRLLPVQANAYRAFWLRRAGSAMSTAGFDTVFPRDPALQPVLAASLRRIAGAGQ